MSERLPHSVSTRRKFARGDVIFHERERATCAYVIESGLVEISTTVGTESRVLTTLGPAPSTTSEPDSRA